MSAFLELLRSRVVLGDGALGTLLHQRCQPLHACYDALNLQQRDLIQQVHQEYLDADAQLIETNTFCDAVLEHFQGIYLITPPLRFDLTANLSRHVRGQAKAASSP